MSIVSNPYKNKETTKSDSLIRKSVFETMISKPEK